jgi:hypothetical protein
LIANPEVLVLHKPFINYEQQHKANVKRALMAHNENRGIGLPADWRENRRPRTIFFSVVDLADCDIADVVWQIMPDKAVRLMAAKPMMPQQAETLGVSQHSSLLPAPQLLPAAGTLAEPVRLAEAEKQLGNPLQAENPAEIAKPMEAHSTQQLAPELERKPHPMLARAQEKRPSRPGSRAGSVVGGILSGRASPLASGRPSLTHNSVEAIKGALRAALPNGNGISRQELATYEMATLQENGFVGGGDVCQDFLMAQHGDMVSKVEVLDLNETYEKPCVALGTQQFQKPSDALGPQQMPYGLEKPESGDGNLQSRQMPRDAAPLADAMQTSAMPAEGDHRVIGEALREAVEPLRRELAGLKPATIKEPGPKRAAALNLNEARMLAKEEFTSALKQEQATGTGDISMPPLGKLDDTVRQLRINGT